MFQACERHHFLHQFPNGWPVEEFLKTYLKNKCTYARKQGYLTEKTNWEQDQDQDDEEEEDKGKGKEKDIQEKDSEIEDTDVPDDMYESEAV